jgi:ABC-type antimicrobial peptide transport system permease subunit
MNRIVNLHGLRFDEAVACSFGALFRTSSSQRVIVAVDSETPNPTDPTSVLSAAGVLLFAALVAVFVPSRRALRVNPMTALREE